jgi:mycothiol synthase
MSTDAMGSPFPPQRDGIAWRPLADDDAEALHQLFRAGEVADQQPWVTTLEEVRHSMGDATLELERDTLAGWAEGRLVCFGAARRRGQATRRRIVYQDGLVHPAWRRRGLGDAVMAWTEARSAAIVAAAQVASDDGLPAFCEAYAEDRLVGHAALYTKRGYRPIRWYQDMRRRLAEPLPARPMPDGIRLAGWSAEIDDELRETHSRVFEDHWGSEPFTPEEWRLRFTGSPAFRPDLTVTAWQDDCLVGYVIGYHATGDIEATGRREGWLGQVGTRREWRGRGLASALMVHVMRLMREAGMDDAMLDVDSDNPSGAAGLYERLGFRTERRTIRYEKAIP